MTHVQTENCDLIFQLQGQSKDEVIKKTTVIIDNLFNSCDPEIAVTEFRETKIPDRFMTDVLVNVLTHVFNNKNASKYFIV